MLLQTTNLYKKLQKQYSRRINLDLSRIKKVLLKLDNPHLKIKNPINIIGSDGKMSVLTSLQSFLTTDKKYTASFTSPHLFDLRKRFFLKNKFISLKDIKKFINIIEETKEKLTLFELLTCIYILASKDKKKLSYNLIESGLFFRKDSTNLWNYPRAQIITNINFQHQEWIRPKTINEICKQKVKYLSKKTTIYIAKQEKNTLKIIKKILQNNPSKKIYSNNWKLIENKEKIFYKDNKVKIPINSKYIHSDGLKQNLCLAIKVALDLGVKKSSIIKTIPKIKFEGRVQYIKKGKLRGLLNNNEKLLLDGCHSEKSAINLYNYLKSVKEPIYGVIGMQKNKMPETFIKSFKNIFQKIIILKTPDEPNAIEPKYLKKILQKNNYKCETAKSILSSLQKITNKKKKLIVVFGSLYLVGSFLKFN